MNIQDWFPLRWTGWISLQSKGLSKISNTTVQKHQFFSAQPSLESNYIPPVPPLFQDLSFLTWALITDFLWLVFSSSSAFFQKKESCTHYLSKMRTLLWLSPNSFVSQWVIQFPGIEYQWILADFSDSYSAISFVPSTLIMSNYLKFPNWSMTLHTFIPKYMLSIHSFHKYLLSIH